MQAAASSRAARLLARPASPRTSTALKRRRLPSPPAHAASQPRLTRLCACHYSLQIAQPAPPGPRASPSTPPARARDARPRHASALSLIPAVVALAQGLAEPPQDVLRGLGAAPQVCKRTRSGTGMSAWRRVAPVVLLCFAVIIPKASASNVAFWQATSLSRCDNLLTPSNLSIGAIYVTGLAPMCNECQPFRVWLMVEICHEGHRRMPHTQQVEDRALRPRGSQTPATPSPHTHTSMPL